MAPSEIGQSPPEDRLFVVDGAAEAGDELTGSVLAGGVVVVSPPLGVVVPSPSS